MRRYAGLKVYAHGRVLMQLSSETPSLRARFGMIDFHNRCQRVRPPWLCLVYKKKWNQSAPVIKTSRGIADKLQRRSRQKEPAKNINAANAITAHALNCS